MTPVPAPSTSFREPAPSPRGQSERGSSRAFAARRRRTLLALARRHGEVRVALKGSRGASCASCEIIELLDGLNEDGLLRYGGLHRSAAGAELIYRTA